MKIAVSSDGPNLDAKVANRFRNAEYLLIIDLDTGESSVDNEGNIYFTHHFCKDGVMLDADIYVIYRK